MSINSDWVYWTANSELTGGSSLLTACWRACSNKQANKQFTWRVLLLSTALQLWLFWCFFCTRSVCLCVCLSSISERWFTGPDWVLLLLLLLLIPTCANSLKVGALWLKIRWAGMKIFGIFLRLGCLTRSRWKSAVIAIEFAFREIVVYCCTQCAAQFSVHSSSAAGFSSTLNSRKGENFELERVRCVCAISCDTGVINYSVHGLGCFFLASFWAALGQFAMRVPTKIAIVPLMMLLLLMLPLTFG